MSDIIKAYKIEILVLDFEDSGDESIKDFFGFLIITSVFFVGLEIVKNIHRSTARHMKHNANLLNIMIDKLKVNK